VQARRSRRRGPLPAHSYLPRALWTAGAERSADLIITHNFQGNVFAESQRDSATKPRVARNELPWVRVVDISNPERVASSCVPWLAQPRWGCDRNERPPMVVALLQPWALRRNPFGIQNFIMKDVGNNKAVTRWCRSRTRSTLRLFSGTPPAFRILGSSFFKTETQVRNETSPKDLPAADSSCGHIPIEPDRPRSATAVRCRRNKVRCRRDTSSLHARS